MDSEKRQVLPGVFFIVVLSTLFPFIGCLMRRVYDILESLFGKSKQGAYDRNTVQYQWNCPWCADDAGGPDNKYNMETSFDEGVFHCWSCNRSGRISRLIKERGSASLFTEYLNILEDVKESAYYNIDMFRNDGLSFYEEQVRLPKTFRKIQLEAENRELSSYLISRGITQDIVDFYGMGVTSHAGEDYKWRDRIILPSYNAFGDLNYFVGRTYVDKDRRSKYKNCDVDKSRIIFNECHVEWDSDIYLVEGALDSIYLPNAVSMLGKTMSNEDVLYKSIVSKANANVVVCLDSDTSINETLRIYAPLYLSGIKDRMAYVRLGTDELPWKDFGEAYESGGKDAIMKVVSSTKRFEEKDILIFAQKSVYYKRNFKRT